jgi:ABC-type multidrug transport system ATPase subunit
MKLIADAPIIALDEPASDLDAYGANQLVKRLYELSSSEFFHPPGPMKFFMEVLLLGHGRIMYT